MVLETLRATYKGNKKKMELEEELVDFRVVGGDWQPRFCSLAVLT